MNKTLLHIFQAYQLVPSERMVLLYIAQSPCITYDTLATYTGLSADRTRRVIWKLRDAGLICLNKAHKEATTVTLAGVCMHERDWSEYVEISDKPDVRETFEAFADSPSEDNAIFVIKAVEESL